MADSINNNPYRWVVLFVLVCCLATINFSNLIFASRAIDIMQQFNMNEGQVAAITTIGMLPGVALSIFIGAIMDKRGLKQFVGLGLLVTTGGLVWRIFAGSFIELLIITIITGTFLLPVNIAAPKIIGYWFAKKDLPVSMGIYGASAGVGTSLAFFFGNLFSSSQTAFTAIAFICAFLFILWMALVKDKPPIPVELDQAELPPPPPDSLKRVVKSPNLWKTMVVMGLAIGAALLINIYMTQAMQMEKGMSAVQAGVFSGTLNICLVIGGVISGIIVGKIAKINVPYAFFCIVGAILYLFVWFLPFGTHTYILLALAGLIVSGSIGVDQTRIPLLPLTGEFGFESVATAAGLNGMVVAVFAFLIPTTIATIVGNHYDVIFIIASVMFIVAGTIGLTIPELGAKGKLAQAARKAQSQTTKAIDA